MNKAQVDAQNQVLRNAIMEGTPEDIIERYISLPEIAKTADFGIYDENIVVIDTETTGVSFRKDALTQIAAARLEHGEITEWFVTFVNPDMPIPDEITHLTGITDEDVADAPDTSEALTKLVDFVGDAKIVAHNAAFDQHFVTSHPSGYPLLENDWIDSLDLARISLVRMKSHRLLDLVRAFGAPLSTHRADEDVASTCALYRILLAAIKEMPSSLVHEISQLTTPNEWPTGKVFAYFADQAKLEYAEKYDIAYEDVRDTFSLRAMRRDRVRTINLKPKRDAADLAPSDEGDAGARDNATGVKGERATGAAPSSIATPNASAAPDANATSNASASHTDSSQTPSTLVFPSEFDMEDAFSDVGILGEIYEDYETRTEQLAMAQAVLDAFATSTNLVVEAGTGVGKSMAYLVPAAFVAHNNDITVGIATKTNALLDQLVYKELPALNEVLDEALIYTSLKGFTHYICLRKVQRLVESGAQMREVRGEPVTQAPAIAALLSYIEQTEYGDIDNLKIDYQALPRWMITTTSHECLRRKCPFYGNSCFVHGQRKIAECSDIVVTNHSLLFCDVAADGGLLPPIRYWIIDEAHNAENEARHALSLGIATDELAYLANRVGFTETTRNVFVRTERTVVLSDGSVSKDELGKDTPDAATLFFGLLNKAKTAGRDFESAEEDFSLSLCDLTYFDTQKKSSYDIFDLWINDEVRNSSVWATVSSFAHEMIDRAEKLINCCSELVAFLDDMENAAVVQREIAAIAIELKTIVDAATTIFIQPSDSYVYAAKLSRKGCKTLKKAKPRRARALPGMSGTSDQTGISDTIDELAQAHNSISAMLYNVGATLDETLYANTNSIVFTSATISVNESFEPFEQAMGLYENDRTNELMLRSSYDFDANMKVYVVSDMPEPGTLDYTEALTDLLIEAHRAQLGSMLTLFTNKKEMESCYSEVYPALKSDDLRVVCQRWGVSPKGLRDEFIANESLSLFATKSFWEGFDAPGSTLRGVTVPKLPFAKPDDPLSRERASRDDYAWRNFVLPQAVLEIKQAAGRLIRRADDTGSLILADSRLVTKSYGQVFLRSLPSQNISIVTREELIEALKRNA